MPERRFNPQFKAEAVQMVFETGKPHHLRNIKADRPRAASISGYGPAKPAARPSQRIEIIGNRVTTATSRKSSPTGG